MKKHISALRFRIKMLLKYRYLLALLVERDIKLKYRRSFLGYLWSILNPLFSMIIMMIVFSYMFGRGIKNFPVYLISGNILFAFMRDSSTLAMNSIIGNAALLKKVYVPKYIFTLSKVTSSLVNLLFSLGALLIVMVITKVPITWYCLLIVIPIIELYIFCVGLGLFLAQANVFFRDIGNIWGVVTLAWMYLTPIFYSIDNLSPVLRYWIPKVNPMYIYITQFRDFVLTGGWTWTVLIWRGLFISLLMLAIGLWSFARNKDKFILYI
jgi:lipopolysaccharide transport system permease protein